MIKMLLNIPLAILYLTFNATAGLCLTIVGIPIAFCTLVCGLGLAIAAVVLIMLPIGILLLI